LLEPIVLIRQVTRSLHKRTGVGGVAKLLLAEFSEVLVQSDKDVSEVRIIGNIQQSYTEGIFQNLIAIDRI
jgi:hypothetical protein